MTSHTPFELKALEAVKYGIEGSLSETGKHLALFFDAPAENLPALKIAAAASRRTSSLLKSLGLEGLRVFWSEFEQSLAELVERPGEIAPRHHDVLRRALYAVSKYLDALAHGAPDATLRLFPHYQELHHLRGEKETLEQDLFYPRLDVELPDDVYQAVAAEQDPASLKTLRTQYQQAMLKWLFRKDTQASLQRMRESLDAVMRLMPQNEQRAFWWLGTGVIDCIMLDDIGAELNVSRILSKIDLQIRAVADGSDADNRALINEMLYLIGNSHAKNDRLESIRETYLLSEYLPDPKKAPVEAVESMLNNMRAHLRVAEESWTRAVLGDAAACEQFARQVDQLVAESQRFEQDMLLNLASSIQAISRMLDTPEKAPLVAIDMAMALLLLDNGIEHSPDLGDEFMAQSSLLFKAMQAALNREAENAAQLKELVNLQFSRNPDATMIPLAHEMLVNLHQVSESLHACFGMVIPQHERISAVRLLDQVLGGLYIASLPDVRQQLLQIRNEMDAYSDGDRSAERLPAARWYTQLRPFEQYLQRIADGQRPESVSLEPIDQTVTLDVHQASASMADPDTPDSGKRPETSPTDQEDPPDASPPDTDDAPRAAIRLNPVYASTRNQFDMDEFTLPALQYRSRERVSKKDFHQGSGLAEDKDEIDPRLLPVFLEEVDDLCPRISAGLRAWRQHPDDEQQQQTLKRLLHTIKGSSRMLGAMRIGEAIHLFEEQVASDLQLRLQPGYWDAMEREFDRITLMLDKLRGSELQFHAEQGYTSERREARGRRESDDHLLNYGNEVRKANTSKVAATSVNTLRVRSELVDRLVNAASEIGITRSRLESELLDLNGNLNELASSVTRLNVQMQELDNITEDGQSASKSGFDTSGPEGRKDLRELSRFIKESVRDLQVVQKLLSKNSLDTSALLHQQAQLSQELQRDLLSVRTVSCNSIADRLYRVVRQTGKALGKRVNLELQGANVEIDRSVLERLVAPFEHLLRNAIAHGVETNELRLQAGKKPTGEILLNVRQMGNDIVFELSDDGAGLNLLKLRERAVVRGLLKPEQQVGDEQIARLIFAPGLSTSDVVTEIAGRGIGLDIVRNEVNALGGTVEVTTRAGHGTRFSMRLPLTMAVTRVLLVRSGNSEYAIPSSMLEKVLHLGDAEMREAYRSCEVAWEGRNYTLHLLQRLLGYAAAPEAQPHSRILLMQGSDDPMALYVDEVLGMQEVVVKNLGPQLAGLPEISGATLLGDGEITLILNPMQLVKRGPGDEQEPAETSATGTPQVILVVDDSLTMRKITERTLTRAGYQVVTARDGVDALDQLKRCVPRLVIVDIEMPQMDGYELVRELRRLVATRSVPIIMISSRSAENQRDYALEAGVNRYLDKTYHEELLLRSVAELLSNEWQ
jgi:chemotaxis protein histidine kinase CheA/ActR/RegA family two-component response regulator